MRFGILGSGVVGALHARLIADMPGVAELVAVADADPARAGELAARHGCAALGSAAELYARDDVDAVVISLPSGLHAEAAVPALEAGKHVVIEKPIDVSLAAADRILAAERASGRYATVISQRRFEPSFRTVKAAIDAGEFGRLTSGAAEVTLWREQSYYDSGGWRGTWAMDGGGALMNQGVHVVDLMLSLLGPAEEVSAYAGLLAHERIEVEDTAVAAIRFASGALGRLFASTAAYGGASVRLSVHGEQGHAVVDNEVLSSFHAARQNRTPEHPEPRLGPEAHRAQLADFVEAVRQGRPPQVTAADGRAALALVLAVYESARVGGPVKPA
ncbi:Gfo/Idh/MocA family oxidoreductase [Nonomuraea longicatena]|uniref:Gfo/Idh/MocA family oxidoreductase n=1 Tax=Nonomuraea longicatena TaxID=83682 RepID=A0ABP3ZM93_9ACTN